MAEVAEARPAGRGRPAMTMREIRIAVADGDAGRHWSHGECWCESWHRAEATTLPLVVPPWDAARGNR